jgi:hypothetical protein
LPTRIYLEPDGRKERVVHQNPALLNVRRTVAQEGNTGTEFLLLNSRPLTVKNIR